MTSERAQAYGRVMKTLGDVSAAKLLPAEQQRVREAADTLLFSDDSGAPDARSAHEDMRALAAHLVESGRWGEDRARQLAADVDACGPFVPAAF